jgi:hypothetical protein
LIIYRDCLALTLKDIVGILVLSLEKGKKMKLFAYVVFLLALIIVGPLVSIWALNTLFPALAIPYTFWTWLAMFIVGGALQARVR